MGAFVISYVPNVENVDNIELLKKVNQLDNITNVETVQDIMTVHDVGKLPHPYFPLKKYNYQYGGSLHITSTQNLYQAVYTPGIDCEFKGVHLCFTSYNIEDTYDVMIGSRYIMQGSHVKEMSEYRMLETYEVVPAGTPIVIQFHNNSGLEKYLLFEVVTLVDESVLNNSDVLNWTFDWEDISVLVGEQDLCSLIINQPNYVNMDSDIDNFTLDIRDTTTQLHVAAITYQDDVLSSDYIEDEPEYQGSGFLARVNVTAITSVTRFDKSIQIVFMNINDTGTLDPHPIEIGISGDVNNLVNGGI